MFVRLKSVVFSVALMGIGTVVGLLTCEIGLRIGGVSYPSFFTVDEYRGVAFRPGAEGQWFQEGEAYIRITSAGLRDKEHTKVKSANTIRIAILGDSYAAAFQVPMEDTFWAVMERELGQCAPFAGRKVEVINFGVSGYGTVQELMTLRHHVWEYDPDIVVLAFTTGNDVRNNLRALEADPLKPYFVYKDGKPVLDFSFREAPEFRARKTVIAQILYGLLNYSRTLQVLNQLRNIVGNRKSLARQYEIASQAAGREAGLEEGVYFEPHNSLWEDAWHVTEAVLMQMQTEVKEKGADFLLVTLSNSIQVHPDPQVRQTFMKGLGIQELLYPDLRISALGKREGMSVLTLAPALQTYAEQHKVFLHGFANATIGSGHWNAQGHKVAGQLITQQLCAEFSLRASSK
jgi:hypothetical protein